MYLFAKEAGASKPLGGSNPPGSAGVNMLTHINTESNYLALHTGHIAPSWWLCSILESIAFLSLLQHIPGVSVDSEPHISHLYFFSIKFFMGSSREFSLPHFN